jgi:hypothetical protein
MNTQLIFIILLSIHIACGFSSLFSAFGAIFSPKGQPKHRFFGTCFFYGMTGIFITAIPLSLIKSNLFLFLIAIFSYYLAFSGWRYAKNRGGFPMKLDWVVSIIMLSASLAMIGFSIYQFDIHQFQTIVLLVFGSTGSIFSISDLKTYRNHSATSKQRIIKHFSAMLGATIATVTAFSVTNIPLKPQIILWLGPTIVFTPIIIWWKHKVLASKSSMVPKEL